MRTVGRILALIATLVAVPATALAASSTLPGTWRTLPAPPAAIPQGPLAVWAGTRLIVLGRTPATNPSVNVASSYSAASNRWTPLSPPPGPDYVPGRSAVWTGRELLAFGAFESLSFDPARNTWRELRRTLPGGIVVWTGREAIGWGGGCCGDARSNGAAYNPKSGQFRKLPRSPLAASQHPLGAWTGRELVLFVSGFDPDGKPAPAGLARGAAYNPSTNTWRRLAPLPADGPRLSGVAAWDGRDLLVAGAGESSQKTLAFDPAANRWRRLAALPSPRVGASAVWSGRRLLVWGGLNRNGSRSLRNGVAYDPRTNRWSTIAAAPIRDGSAVVWTGRALIVVGRADAAAFTPR